MSMVFQQNMREKNLLRVLHEKRFSFDNSDLTYVCKIIVLLEMNIVSIKFLEIQRSMLVKIM